MSPTTHKCYRCEPEAVQDEGAHGGPLGTIDTTRADDGVDVFFASGYSAREIAQKRAREDDARIYVNNVSRKIKRADLTVPVAYAVAKSPVYTVFGADEHHDGIHRVYWRPFDA